MASKRNRETILLSLIMAAIMTSLAIVFIRNNRDPKEQIASMLARIEMVQAMRLALAETSEAQNNAVMALRELESKKFFEEARQAREKFQKLIADFSDRVKRNGDPAETEQVKTIEQTFEAFRDIDNQISDLDIRNSNGKAFDLAFGPARSTLLEIDSELNRIVVEQGRSPSDQNYDVLRWASDARIRLLRTQTLLAPHIAEASDDKMDEIEKQMSGEDEGILQDLNSLGSALSGDSKQKLANVSSRFADYLSTRAEILRLSRENTSLRSVSMTLNEKRIAMLACQDALATIEKTIRKENIASMIPAGRGQ